MLLFWNSVWHFYLLFYNFYIVHRVPIIYNFLYMCNRTITFLSSILSTIMGRYILSCLSSLLFSRILHNTPLVGENIIKFVSGKTSKLSCRKLSPLIFYKKVPMVSEKRCVLVKKWDIFIKILGKNRLRSRGFIQYRRVTSILVRIGCSFA